jgi:hypothetical protein
MRKIKTAELTGAALDWAVAKCEGYGATIKPSGVVYVHPDGTWHHNGNWRPSTNWAQGGPIIECEGIGILFDSGSACRKPSWFATPDDQSTRCSYEGEQFDPCFMVDEHAGIRGPTPLIAAMRCCVASKLGDEMEIPKELLC